MRVCARVHCDGAVMFDSGSLVNDDVRRVGGGGGGAGVGSGGEGRWRWWG